MSYNSHYQSGGIEVICGPMFSGKTEELIRRVKRAQIAKRRVQIFKPAIDVRYDENKVVSHSALAIEAEPMEKATDIFLNLKDKEDKENSGRARTRRTDTRS